MPKNVRISGDQKGSLSELDFRQWNPRPAGRSRISKDTQSETSVAATKAVNGFVFLGQVIELQPGYAFKSSWFSNSGVRLFRGTNIVPGSTRWDDLVFLSEAQSRDFRQFSLNEGDIVIAMDRPLVTDGLKVTRISASDLPALLVQRVGRFRLTKTIHPDYLYWFLNSDNFIEHITDHATGTQLPHISQYDIESARIFIPTIREQEQVVCRLNLLLDRIQTAENHLLPAHKLLRTYKKSLFESAINGKLTEKWRSSRVKAENELTAIQLVELISSHRKNRLKATNTKRQSSANSSAPADLDLPSLPEGWCWARVDALGAVQLGRQRSPQNRSKDYPTKYIRAANITEDGLDCSDMLDMEFTPEELGRFRLDAGDIVLSEASGSADQVGKPAIWRKEVEDCCFQNTVIRLKPELISSEYLLLVFKSFYYSGNFARTSSGIGINHLTANKFASMYVPVAPPAEQLQIVETVERLLAISESKNSVFEKSLLLLSSLRRKILKQAFSAEQK